MLLCLSLWKIMESLEHALKRGANIIAEYLGGAVTCDAHHMTDPRSDGLGVSSCISKSLEDAGVFPEEVKALVIMKHFQSTRYNHNPIGPMHITYRCLDEAKPIFAWQVNYVNAHATSTLAGDLAEVNAIKKVFKNTSEIKMNGTKVRHFLS